ncbi:hypothetical protein GCM10028822_14550 [Hymenobacter terrigena]
MVPLLELLLLPVVPPVTPPAFEFMPAPEPSAVPLVVPVPMLPVLAESVLVLDSVLVLVSVVDFLLWQAPSRAVPIISAANERLMVLVNIGAKEMI